MYYIIGSIFLSAACAMMVYANFRVTYTQAITICYVPTILLMFMIQFAITTAR